MKKYRTMDDSISGDTTRLFIKKMKAFKNAMCAKSRKKRLKWIHSMDRYERRKRKLLMKTFNGQLLYNCRFDLYPW